MVHIRNKKIIASRVVISILLCYYFMLNMALNVVASNNTSDTNYIADWVRNGIGYTMVRDTNNSNLYVVEFDADYSRLSYYFTLNNAGGGTRITFSNDGYSRDYYYDSNRATEIKEIINAVNGDRVNDALDKIKSAIDINPEFEDAGRVMNPVMRYINVILGMLMIAAGTFMGLYCGFDVFYLSVPLLRGKMDSVAEKGATSGDNKGRIASTTSKATGGNKFRFITDEAVMAMKIYEETGKSKWGTYLKKMIFAWLGLAIIMYMIISGNILLIATLAISIVEGLMSVLEGFIQ